MPGMKVAKPATIRAGIGSLGTGSTEKLRGRPLLSSMRAFPGGYVRRMIRENILGAQMAMVFCRGCGKEIHETAVTCPHCGAPQKAQSPSSGSGSSGMEYLIPIGRSGWAIAAGYLAFFALFLVPAPFALACGVMGLRDIQKNPEKLGKPRAIFGIVMGALGTAFLIFLFLKK